ncbi:hypothetical protein [Ancylobacter mangrovi]|uniref:hypothetical protein n=1 Tax=Ancylobacter mangrovi TaxID=2972472 RepID=UPI0021612152|nr:hypothetical protein [Ancylobacter mangrovi]MCS0503594.1 hypothetical protein [Ancylobacter mangrovi]
MADLTRNNLFKPNLSKTESRAEAVSRTAMGMIQQEATKRDAKLMRLREARLAREAVDAPDAAASKAGTASSRRR